MDPVTFILSALSVAGAKIGDQAIKDGYEGLKSLIVRRFGGTQPKIGERLEDYAKDPNKNAPVADALRSAGAERDTEVLDRAAELVKLVEARSPGAAGSLVGSVKIDRNGKALFAHTIIGDVHF